MVMNAKEIEQRLKNGFAITNAERAFLIAENPYALAGFLIENNPGSVNYSLKQMGYTHLGFEPNKKQLARQLEILIERQDIEAMAYICKNFVLITDNLPQEFINELSKKFNS
jgi:hypothetical protein